MGDSASTRHRLDDQHGNPGRAWSAISCIHLVLIRPELPSGFAERRIMTAGNCPSRAGACRPGSSSRVRRPASAILSYGVTHGGMTTGMTGLASLPLQPGRLGGRCASSGRQAHPRPSDHESDASRRTGPCWSDSACSRWVPRRPGRVLTQALSSTGRARRTRCCVQRQDPSLQGHRRPVSAWGLARCTWSASATTRRWLTSTEPGVVTTTTVPRSDQRTSTPPPRIDGGS
jgi:hypothetical protein